LLRGWLDEDLILLRVLEGVKRAARDWHLNDRNDAWLIHSSGRLEEAKRLYERPDFFSTLDSSDKVYLENAFARENAAQGRQRYRQRVVAMAAGLFLVIAVAATGAAFFAYTQRTLAENQRTLAEKQAIRATQQAMLADEQRARADAQMRLAEEANLRAGSSVSPDAERLLVLDADGRARIINLVTGQEIGRLAIDDGAITSAAFSPDGNKIVTTATNFDIGIWEAKTLKLLSILKGQATATRVVFSHDALLLASAGDENTVHLWSVATGESLFAIRADGSVTALAFSPDGTSLVISTGSGSLDFVDTRTGAVARRIRPSHH
jgi:phosphomannomutase